MGGILTNANLIILFLSNEIGQTVWAPVITGGTTWSASTTSGTSWAVATANAGSWPESLSLLYYDDEDLYDSATDNYDRTVETWSAVSTNSTTWLTTP